MNTTILNKPLMEMIYRKREYRVKIFLYIYCVHLYRVYMYIYIYVSLATSGGPLVEGIIYRKKVYRMKIFLYKYIYTYIYTLEYLYIFIRVYIQYMSVYMYISIYMYLLATSGDDIPEKGVQSEDCLYLNIWTPSAALSGLTGSGSKSLLPVLLWIYGGAFLHGSTGKFKYMFICIRKEVLKGAYVHIYIYIYMYIYLCICIYT
jgi:hypothetical protein